MVLISLRIYFSVNYTPRIFLCKIWRIMLYIWNQMHS